MQIVAERASYNSRFTAPFVCRVWIVCTLPYCMFLHVTLSHVMSMNEVLC